MFVVRPDRAALLAGASIAWVAYGCRPTATRTPAERAPPPVAAPSSGPTLEPPSESGPSVRGATPTVGLDGEVASELDVDTSVDEKLEQASRARGKDVSVPRYVATMHRKIHEGWAWGFLELLDQREKTHILNDYDLWTRVEFVIGADGTLRNARTVRSSGQPAFDEAALEVIRAAAPHDAPPPAMLSFDGNAYLHWALHRDARACGPFGAEVFVLEHAGQERPDGGRAVELPPRPKITQ